MATEYLVVFKGDSFDPIHAMSFDAAVERVEEWVENGAEIHYALAVEELKTTARYGFECTYRFEDALRHRDLAREAAAAKAYVETGAGDYKRDLMKVD